MNEGLDALKSLALEQSGDGRATLREALPVRFEAVHKRYTRGGTAVSVLDGIDLEVRPSEFVALMGPSGSGKSTFLNLVAGLDKPSSGRVTVGSFEPAKMNDKELSIWRSQNIGLILQRYHLFESLTAEENIEVPLMLLALSPEERRARVKSVLALVGLSDRARHFPRQLSGGQEQRVAIARAIVTGPTILLADEPTSDLDARSAVEILDLLVALNERLRKMILMVTHDPKAAARAQRTLHLEKGRFA